MVLHDIFPAIDVGEYSFYSLLFFIILVLSFLYFTFYFFRNRHKKTLPYYLTILERFHPEDAKHIALKLSYYGKYLIKNEAQEKRLNSLIKNFTPYKYLQDDIPIPDALHEELTQFLKTIRDENV